jgi:hypothetical protein
LAREISRVAGLAQAPGPNHTLLQRLHQPIQPFGSRQIQSRLPAAAPALLNRCQAMLLIQGAELGGLLPEGLA